MHCSNACTHSVRINDVVESLFLKECKVQVAKFRVLVMFCPFDLGRACVSFLSRCRQDSFGMVFLWP